MDPSVPQDEPQIGGHPDFWVLDHENSKKLEMREFAISILHLRLVTLSLVLQCTYGHMWGTIGSVCTSG